MVTIPIRELSHHTAQSLAHVKAGESVDITERGKVVGRIVPVDTSNDVRAALTASGRMRPAARGRAAMLADVRRRLTEASENQAIDTDGKASQALQRLRDDERY